MRRSFAATTRTSGIRSNNRAAKPVAFQVDPPGATVVIEQNSIEGIQGVPDEGEIDLRTPAGEERLP